MSTEEKHKQEFLEVMDALFRERHFREEDFGDLSRFTPGDLLGFANIVMPVLASMIRMQNGSIKLLGNLYAKEKAKAPEDTIQGRRA